MSSILIVEDERIVAKDIQETLSQLGYDVVGAAASGEECLRSANLTRPDLVLMDVRLQGDWDGVETARRLKTLIDVPVIFLTAYADDETVSRARETEAHGYILKPFRASELKSAVEIALFKHRMEVELRKSARWFHTTLQAIGDAVIAVDKEQVVSFANPAAENLIADGNQAIAGRKLGEVFRLINARTRQPLTDPLGNVLTKRTVIRLPPGTLLLREHDELPIEDSIAPIVDTDGELLGAVVVFRDIREQHLLREHLAAADRLASLATLSAGVAHEINNPLTYVLANASMTAGQLGALHDELQPLLKAAMAKDALSLLRDAQQQLAEIEDGAKRIQRIVADLRVFARPDSGAGQGDVVKALDWALRVTENALTQRASLEVQLEPLPPVRGDVTRIGQVFVNLLMNAAQALAGEDADEQRVFVTGSVDGDRVVISIEDTGPGMTREVMDRIFEPFFTTKPAGSGTGLGLSVCRSLVEAAGGELTVESEPGVGTTFRVHLPIAPSDPKASLVPDGEYKSRRARILLLDDDRVVAAAIARLLSVHHEVVLEHEPRAALARLARDEAFDVIVCDFVMPELNGGEVYARLAQSHPRLAERVVFLTGAFTSDVAEVLARIPNPCLPKPPSMGELEQIIAGMLERGPVPTTGSDSSSASVSGSARDTLLPSGIPPSSAVQRILVVDDEKVLARALARVLTEAGFETVHCTSVEQAVPLLESGHFDAVLSDVAMPAQDGIALLRKIRSHDLDLPVVLMSGRPNLETALPAVEHGAFRYLVKPVAEDELINTMQEAANLHRLALLKRSAMHTLGTGLGEASGRPGLEASFHRAMDSLWPAFQPILSVRAKSLFGYEALLRSDEPSLPHPGAVLDAAERLGQLHLLGRTMRERTALALQSLQSESTLFLNLHPEDLMDPSLLDPSAGHMAFADRIVLEVTERSALDRVEGAHARVRALREAGFRIAVDDLGAGYAGLSSFVQLEPDLVKLDMSLTRGVDSNLKKQRLVRSMTDVCKDLGLGVVGEGVETAAERDTLAELGCDFLQGFLFGRPTRELTSACW